MDERPRAVLADYATHAATMQEGRVYRGGKACNTCSDVAPTITPAPAPAPSALCGFVLVSESIAKETRLCQDDPSSQYSS